MAARRKEGPDPITTRDQAHAAASQLASEANNMACISDFLGCLDRGEIGINAETADTLRSVLFAWLMETADEIGERAELVTEFLDEKRKAVEALAGNVRTIRPDGGA